MDILKMFNQTEWLVAEAAKLERGEKMNQRKILLNSIAETLRLRGKWRQSKSLWRYKAGNISISKREKDILIRVRT